MGNNEYTADAPTRDEIDALQGPLVLDFGTNWCGHCRAAQPHVDQVLGEQPGIRHIKVEDGSGRALGRSFGVTLWPTLVFLNGGKEMSRVVRPRSAEPVRDALRTILP